MPRAALHTSDQVEAGDDVAPLIAAAGLQAAAVATVELEVVERLQQHVAELRVGDAAALEAGADGLSSQHHVDREVLADVAQEVESRHLLGPLDVVREDRGATLEIDEALELRPHPLQPRADQLLGDELTLGRPPAGVADEPGGTAREHDGAMPGQLEPA